MKLNRWMSGVVAAGAVALACGCGSTIPAAAGASAASAPRDSRDGSSPAMGATGTTSLMSAEIPGPAPKVGKAHLAVDDDDDAPKTATGRHSDGSRRGGAFGSVK